MRKINIKLIALLAGFIVLAFILVGCTPALPTSFPPNTVQIVNFAFSPFTMTVAAGTTVHWFNLDGAAHTVTSSPSGPLASSVLGTGAEYDYTFTVVGTYNYICSIHTYMTGSITVTP